jgi:hypothetical protein
MSKLSLSRAWDETKAVIAHDGRLLTSVALALIALPMAISTVVSPNGLDRSTAIGADLLLIAASLVALAGQLALIRLAIGPSITVGGAIGHGMRRMPLYFLAVLLIVAILVLAAIPLAFALAAMGVDLEQAPREVSGPLFAAAMLYLLLFIYVAVRMIMAAPAASAEDIGPLRIVARSWELTGGHFWGLLGFVLLFFIGAIVVLLAIQTVLMLLVSVLLGPLDPMSASALVVGLVQALANAAISTLFAVMIARLYLQLAGRSPAQPSVPKSGT